MLLVKHFRGLGESSKHFNLQETAANSWTRTNILLQVFVYFVKHGFTQSSLQNDPNWLETVCGFH